MVNQRVAGLNLAFGAICASDARVETRVLAFLRLSSVCRVSALAQNRHMVKKRPSRVAIGAELTNRIVG